jgi:predicted nucleotidyltransferase component of viral defense system
MKMNKSHYEKQSQLVVDVLPFVKDEEDFFALKGGTAINFFVRDLPRLSVDIDLTYIRFTDRQNAFKEINNALGRIVDKLRKNNIFAQITDEDNNPHRKIMCIRGDTEIKIEPNYNARGYSYEPTMLPMSPQAVKRFKGFTEIKTMDKAELYAGKISAALNRQHPRDLFDVKILFENAGITEIIKNAFIVQILSYNKPPYQLLDPNTKDQRENLDKNFLGMTDINFTYQDHEQAFETLKTKLHKSLIGDDKKFIISFFNLNPQWDLVKHIPNIQALPAVKWKLVNLEKVSQSILKDQIEKIEIAFEK